jgi:hypothetical protein
MFNKKEKEEKIKEAKIILDDLATKIARETIGKHNGEQLEKYGLEGADVPFEKRKSKMWYLGDCFLEELKIFKIAIRETEEHHKRWFTKDLTNHK